MKMELLIETRGRAQDYQFLGSAPTRRWWLEYRGTSWEHPTVIVHSRGSRWEAYVGAIPSGRSDHIGRTIRFNLVFAGEAGEPAGDQIVVPLLQGWLDLVTGKDEILRKALDADFTEERVEDWLARPNLGDERDQAIMTWAQKCLGDRKPQPARQFETQAGRWLGSAADVQAQDEFLTHAAGIMRGDVPGRALVLNYVETLKQATEVVMNDAGNAGCVILATNLKEQLATPLVRLPEETPVADGDEPEGGALPPWPVATLFILIAAGMAVGAGYVLWFTAREVWRRIHP
jgi:hypothetical protein